MSQIPPPIIDSAKVLVFAQNDDDVVYTDKIELHVGSTEGEFRRIGEMPYLVIARPYNSPEGYLLLFCNAEWGAEGVIAFTSMEEAKRKAERGYRGISQKWTISPYTEDDLNEFLRNEYNVDPLSEWWSQICSFCGRKESELESVVVGKYASICRQCVLEFYEAFNENA